MMRFLFAPFARSAKWNAPSAAHGCFCLSPVRYAHDETPLSRAHGCSHHTNQTLHRHPRSASPTHVGVHGHTKPRSTKAPSSARKGKRPPAEHEEPSAAEGASHGRRSRPETNKKPATRREAKHESMATLPFALSVSDDIRSSPRRRGSGATGFRIYWTRFPPSRE